MIQKNIVNGDLPLSLFFFFIVDLTDQHELCVESVGL
jgi:hypothetical protein